MSTFILPCPCDLTIVYVQVMIIKGYFQMVNFCKGIFDNCGLSYVWVNQETALPNLNKITLPVKNSLQDQFIQSWLSDMQHSSRGKFYCFFTSECILENYLLRLKPADRKTFCRLRSSNLHLPIEKGRWHGIAREDRICHLCGDEFHYFFKCQNNEIKIIRKQHIPNYYIQYPSPNKSQVTIFNVKLLEGVTCFLRKLEKNNLIHVYYASCIIS